MTLNEDIIYDGEIKTLDDSMLKEIFLIRPEYQKLERHRKLEMLSYLIKWSGEELEKLI